jgi:hypothetical protein
LLKKGDLLVFEWGFLIDPEQSLCVTSGFPWSIDCEIAYGCGGCMALEDKRSAARLESRRLQDLLRSEAIG